MRAVADFQKPAISAHISLAGARAAYFGPSLDLAPHRNAAATVAVALERPFEIRLPEKPSSSVSAIILIPPGAMHHLRASGLMAFIYLDALSDDHRRIAAADLDAAHARIVRDPACCEHVDEVCAVLGIRKRVPADARIAAVVRQIDRRPQDFSRLEDAALLADLSASRFHALFRQAVGMPFRRYRLWRRMAVVMEALAAREQLTNAALDAGFASSAHLSSAFRAMFGLSPSSLAAVGARISSRPSV